MTTLDELWKVEWLRTLRREFSLKGPYVAGYSIKIKATQREVFSNICHWLVHENHITPAWEQDGNFMSISMLTSVPFSNVFIDINNGIEYTIDSWWRNGYLHKSSSSISKLTCEFVKTVSLPYFLPSLPLPRDLINIILDFIYIIK